VELREVQIKLYVNNVLTLFQLCERRFVYINVCRIHLVTEHFQLIKCSRNTCFVDPHVSDETHRIEILDLRSVSNQMKGSYKYS